MTRSIQQWELPDGTFGIQQIRQDGLPSNIPGSKLLIFVNERQGDNWWGTSMLRGAYKHWYYKDNFYKIDAVAFERQGPGVPKILPIGATLLLDSINLKVYNYTVIRKPDKPHTKVSCSVL